MADIKDTKAKTAKHVLTEKEVDDLRREVEILELRARRKAALDSMRGDQTVRGQSREERKAERRKTRRKS